AVVAFREALKDRSRERVPLDWAATQNNLGGALFYLSAWEKSTEKLKEAITALQSALSVFEGHAPYYAVQIKRKLEWMQQFQQSVQGQH
ncbi:MAG: hypothetical protein LBL69_05155, partial [Zoogloeaceae bacterium]|nr:hypothetical protein [Zoogloeaceae bacterium]